MCEQLSFSGRATREQWRSGMAEAVGIALGGGAVVVILVLAWGGRWGPALVHLGAYRHLWFACAVSAKRLRDAGVNKWLLWAFAIAVGLAVVLGPWWLWSSVVAVVMAALLAMCIFMESMTDE